MNAGDMVSAFGALVDAYPRPFAPDANYKFFTLHKSGDAGPAWGIAFAAENVSMDPTGELVRVPLLQFQALIQAADETTLRCFIIAQVYGELRYVTVRRPKGAVSVIWRKNPLLQIPLKNWGTVK